MLTEEQLNRLEAHSQKTYGRPLSEEQKKMFAWRAQQRAYEQSTRGRIEHRIFMVIFAVGMFIALSVAGIFAGIGF
jgi:hypothetical protein